MKLLTPLPFPTPSVSETLINFSRAYSYVRSKVFFKADIMSVLDGTLLLTCLLTSPLITFLVTSTQEQKRVFLSVQITKITARSREERKEKTYLPTERMSDEQPCASTTCKRGRATILPPSVFRREILCQIS